MAGKADFAELKVLGHLLGKRALASPDNYFIRLYTVSPADDGTGGTEVAGFGYAPLQIANSTANFVFDGAAIKNGVDFAFAPAAGGSWTGIAAFGMWDASSGGNAWFVNDLEAPVTVGDGQIFKFAAGDLIFLES